MARGFLRHVAASRAGPSPPRFPWGKAQLGSRGEPSSWVGTKDCPPQGDRGWKQGQSPSRSAKAMFFFLLFLNLSSPGVGRAWFNPSTALHCSTAPAAPAGEGKKGYEPSGGLLLQKLSLLERREGDLVSGMEPQGCGTGPTMGSCEGWRGDRSQPKPPLLLRGLCRVSWQAAGADEARLGLQCGSRKGLFLSISIPCYQGSAAGREGRRQGPRHRGWGGHSPATAKTEGTG